MTEHPTNDTSPGPHLATVSYDGRFWDVYVEFSDEAHHSAGHRARLTFIPGDPGDGEEPIRTAVILIEPSYEEVIHRARKFENHQLVALLRSALPGD